MSTVYLLTSGLGPYKQVYQNIWHGQFHARGLFAISLTSSESTVHSCSTK